MTITSPDSRIFHSVEYNMTEIHERLQPVAEVGENGSNGDDDSIDSDQSPLPIGNNYYEKNNITIEKN